MTAVRRWLSGMKWRCIGRWRSLRCRFSLVLNSMFLGCLFAKITGKWVIVFEVTIPLHWNYFEDLFCRVVSDRRFHVVVASRDIPASAQPSFVAVPTTNDYELMKRLPKSLLLTSSSFPGKQSVYVMHSLVSTHVVYPQGCFDGFGSIFCAGPHHLKELEAALQNRTCGKCSLVPSGYEYVDRLVVRGQRAASGDTRRLHVLFAPSWGKGNVLARCGDRVVESLIETYDVCLRPHVQNLKEDGDMLDRIRSRFASDPHFTLDTEPSAEPQILGADLVVSDSSGLAFEYALVRLRPVIFLDGPMKVFNEGWQECANAPGIERTYRERIGVVIKDVDELPGRAQDLLAEVEAWRGRILPIRDELLYHFGKSADVAYRAVCALARGEIGDRWRVVGRDAA